MSNCHPIHATLKEMPVFKSFTDAELEKFLSISDPCNYRKDDFIVRQGDEGDCMFFVAEGSCRVSVNREGRSAELTILGPGTIFGELALFEHRPRFADVQAVADCVLLKVSEPMLHALAALYPAAAYKLLAGIIRAIGDRLRKTSVRVLDSLFPDVPPSRE